MRDLTVAKKKFLAIDADARRATLGERMRSIWRRLLLLIIAVSMTATSTSISTVRAAQLDYPTRVVRIIAGAAPGGLIDQFARVFASELQVRSGQPVVVENNSIATGLPG
jgi:hypothetical protein